VFPPPLMTVGWRPMLNTSVLDWEASPEPGHGPGGSER